MESDRELKYMVAKFATTSLQGSTVHKDHWLKHENKLTKRGQTVGKSMSAM